MVAVSLPLLSYGARSTYLKVRDRAQYDFALASAAVALDLSGNTIRQARVGLGGVATIPWRSPQAEDLLRDAPATRDTFERAADAALAEARGPHQRGDPEKALATGPVRIEQTYRTPTEHHNPMEAHGTIAQWNGERLTLHDSSQWAFGVQRRIAKVFGIGAEQSRVIVPYVGGAFGSKGQMWSHVALAAMAAKLVGRPVKLIVTRPQMFGWVGHRPQTEQRVALGAQRDGRLVTVTHDILSETSVSDEFVEPCAVFSRDLYAVGNYGMSHALPRLNISKPTY
jgi:CO/xanthine dehydrogenase Mo-binding subunit